ncbi:MAG: 2-oxoacid:ferredoxin oxidoreductase subunit beta [Acidobacteria bacterium]|nr:2-oxoacid:ferredoxin oxidoreductase subunit beta [Acidobacteriota bacterium]MBU4494379.1 2-oxoacid:ferredoxin oxidoreductase subunit beta [Acidobacteriota bacterium]
MNSYKDYVKWDRMPTTWCGGCSIGMVFKQLTFTLEQIQMPKERLVVVSGIGCSGRAAGYFDVDSVHTTHGRALPVAEGIKRANPELNVVVFSGDGDLTGIGGNHLIHTSRRDTDLTVICINNEIYGMTGGQMAPTTKRGAVTLTSAAGNAYYPLNLQGLLTSVPRHFYARSSAYRINHLQKCIKEGLGWKGFAFIDVISFCIENNGRRLGYKNGFEMLDKLKADFKINTDPSGPLAANELGIIQNENQKS